MTITVADNDETDDIDDNDDNEDDEDEVRGRQLTVAVMVSLRG